MAPNKQLNMRPTTVYDLASLRLHSDGMLAQKRPVLSAPTPRNRVTIRDARGNWMAKDAVGRMTVNKHRVKGRTIGGKEVSDEESFNSTRIADGNNTVSGRANRKEKGQERDVSLQSLPSSDLLKCIHHFASNYYAERCQLSRHPVEKEKSRSRESSEDVFTSSPTPDDEDTSEDESSDSGHSRSEPIGPTLTDNRERNMYKIMDGSALMAIGMLLQEYVGHLLTPQLPDGWEDEMLSEEEDGSDGVPIPFLATYHEDGHEDGNSGHSSPQEQLPQLDLTGLISFDDEMSDILSQE